MAKAAQKVLIVEDDSQLASALKTGFSREGFQVFVTAKAEEAKEILNQNRINSMFVDCLLPGKNGVELVKSIRESFPASSLDVIMMSGIFTDPNYVRDTIRTTQAIQFLKKPFDLKEAFSFLKKDNTVVEEIHPRKQLYQMFNNSKVTAREKRRSIEALEEIHGFDLPYIYSLLMESKASGHLNIVNAKGEVSGISFSQGMIVAVDIVDQETYLGKLLIESGYIQSDDLKDALNSNSTKKIGEKLIQGNLLSPHAFNIVLANQMSIRLSRTIVDGSVHVNFVSADVEQSFPHIDQENLGVFLHDWIAAKINSNWLKAHYTQWADYTLEKSPTYVEPSAALEMPLVTSTENLVASLTSGKTLLQILDSATVAEDSFLKATHYLLTKGLIVFNEKVEVESEELRIKKLKKILSQVHEKNKVEIFDIMVRMCNVSEQNPQSVINEFLKILGPEPAPAQKELLHIYQQLKTTASQATDFTKTGSREKMKEEIAKVEIEQRLQAATQYEEAKTYLARSQYQIALQKLEKAIIFDPTLDKAKLFLIWAKLGGIESKPNKMTLLKAIDADLLQVPPEEKFDALYSFVMGLYYKAKGDISTARKSFQKAVDLDSTLTSAKRELTLVQTKASSNSPKDVLNRDLKELIGGFFNKKK